MTNILVDIRIDPGETPEAHVPQMNEMVTRAGADVEHPIIEPDTAESNPIRDARFPLHEVHQATEPGSTAQRMTDPLPADETPEIRSHGDGRGRERIVIGWIILRHILNKFGLLDTSTRRAFKVEKLVPITKHHLTSDKFLIIGLVSTNFAFMIVHNK